MSLRSPYQNSITANLSLIGLEAGIDRVFDEGNSSLLANYRYSTVGLLGQWGLTLEEIRLLIKTYWLSIKLNGEIKR